MKRYSCFIAAATIVAALWLSVVPVRVNGRLLSAQISRQYYSDVFNNGTSSEPNDERHPVPGYSNTNASTPANASESTICATIHSQADPCSLARTTCEDSSFIQYSRLYFCTSPKQRWLIVVFMLVFLYLLFFVLSHNADIYLSPSIQQVADFFNVSDEVTGAVFLSFCNGAPDFFTALASSASDSFDLILGNVLGAGLFATNVVIGFIVLGSIVYYNSFVESLAQFNFRAAQIIKARNSSRESSKNVVKRTLLTLCRTLTRQHSKVPDEAASTKPAPDESDPRAAPIVAEMPLSTSNIPVIVTGAFSTDEASRAVNEDNLESLIELDQEIFEEVVQEEALKKNESITAANRAGMAAKIHSRFVRHLVNPFQNVFAAIFRNDIAFRGYAINATSYFRNLFVYMLAIVSMFLIFQFRVITLWIPILFLVAYVLFITFILGQRWWHEMRRKAALRRNQQRSSLVRTLIRNSTRSRSVSRTNTVSRSPSGAASSGNDQLSVSQHKVMAEGKVSNSMTLKPDNTIERPAFVEDVNCLKNGSYFISPRQLLWVVTTLSIAWKIEFSKESLLTKPLYVFLTPLRFLTCITTAPSMLQLIDDSEDLANQAEAEAEEEDVDVNKAIDSEINKVEVMLSTQGSPELPNLPSISSTPEMSDERGQIPLPSTEIAEAEILAPSSPPPAAHLGNNTRRRFSFNVESPEPVAEIFKVPLPNPEAFRDQMSYKDADEVASTVSAPLQPMAYPSSGSFSYPARSLLPPTTNVANSSVTGTARGALRSTTTAIVPPIHSPLELANSFSSEEQVFFAKVKSNTATVKQGEKKGNALSMPSGGGFLEVPNLSTSANNFSSSSRSRGSSPRFMNWSTPSFGRSFSRSPMRSMSRSSHVTNDQHASKRRWNQHAAKYSKGFVRYVYQMSELADWQLLLFRIRCAVFPPFAAMFALFATKHVTTPVSHGSPVQVWMIVLPLSCIVSVLLFLSTNSLSHLGKAVRELLSLVPKDIYDSFDNSAAGSMSRSPLSASQVIMNSLARSKTLTQSRRKAAAASPQLNGSLHPPTGPEPLGKKNSKAAGVPGGSMYELDVSNSGTLGQSKLQTEKQTAEVLVRRMLAWVSVGSNILQTEYSLEGTLHTQGSLKKPTPFASKAPNTPRMAPPNVELVSSNAPSPFLSLRTFTSSLATPLTAKRSSGEDAAYLANAMNGDTAGEPLPQNRCDEENGSSLVSRAFSKLKAKVNSSLLLEDSRSGLNEIEEEQEERVSRNPSLPDIVISPDSPARGHLDGQGPTSKNNLSTNAHPPRLVVDLAVADDEEGSKSSPPINELEKSPTNMNSATPLLQFSASPTHSISAAENAGYTKSGEWNLRVEPSPSLRSNTSAPDFEPITRTGDTNSMDAPGIPELRIAEPSVRSASLMAPDAFQQATEQEPFSKSGTGNFLAVPNVNSQSLSKDKYSATLTKPEQAPTIARTISNQSAVQIYFTYNNLVKPLKLYYYLQLVLNVLTLAICILWIYATANEVVGLLLALSRSLNLSQGLMGVTILAWGNTFGDLFADMAMAKAGNFHAAITAAFTGPIMNIFLTVGITFLTARIRAGANITLSAFQPQQYLAFAFLMFGLLFIGVFLLIFYFKLRLPKLYALTLLGYYLLFFITICIAEAFL